MGKFLKNYKYIIIAGFVILGGILYYVIDPTSFQLTPKCPVKLLTSYSCPGCGFQRALHATLHAHYSEAIHYNLFLLVAIPIIAIWCINIIIVEKTSNGRLKKIILYLNKRIIYFYILCYGCWFVIRNVYNI